ncbi:MAG: pyridoxal-phosphate dependent enzyme [Clostridia bacterium]
MSLISTRGGSAVTASQAILHGLAPNGGLYVPGMLPAFSLQEIASFSSQSYAQRATRVLSSLLDDFSSAEVAQCVQAAYHTGHFDAAEIAPVKTLRPGLHVLELFHGPTLAFKDMALQILPHLMHLAAQKCGETREVLILVATSGDTGKAALEGFADVPGTRCAVFYPKDGVSSAQRLQMITQAGENTHVVAVLGNFDDAQTGVKRLFSDGNFQGYMHAQGRVLSSANSINFGRLAPQVAYYFSAYADLLQRGEVTLGAPVHFVH